MPTPTLRSGWIADCHVHLHSAFDVTAFLDGAARNLHRADAPGFTGMLCLTDIGSQDSLARVRHGARGWSVEETQEAESVLLRGAAGVLAIIAGRQVVTAERLEVLALGSRQPIADGASLDRTLELADATGAVAVLPWGVGKWTFERGRIIARVLERADPRALFVGDNGNRPGIVPEPRLLRVARARGFRILPGSDPLPLAFHADRAGSCAALIDCVPDLQRPARQFVRLLLETAIRPEPVCRPESLARFALGQTMIRLRRRAPRPQTAS